MEALTVFFVAIAVALAVLLCLTFFISGGARFNSTVIFASGFVVGMLTLYIKMKLLGF